MSPDMTPLISVCEISDYATRRLMKNSSSAIRFEIFLLKGFYTVVCCSRRLNLLRVISRGSLFTVESMRISKLGKQRMSSILSPFSSKSRTP